MHYMRFFYASSGIFGIFLLATAVILIGSIENSFGDLKATKGDGWWSNETIYEPVWGYVTSPNGVPAAGVLLELNYWVGSDPVFLKTTTDSSGYYSFGPGSTRFHFTANLRIAFK